MIYTQQHSHFWSATADDIKGIWCGKTKDEAREKLLSWIEEAATRTEEEFQEAQNRNFRYKFQHQLLRYALAEDKKREAKEAVQARKAATRKEKWPRRGVVKDINYRGHHIHVVTSQCRSSYTAFIDGVIAGFWTSSRLEIIKMAKKEIVTYGKPRSRWGNRQILRNLSLRKAVHPASA